MKKQNRLEQINNTVINGIESPAALLIIFTLVYIIAEAHNLSGFAQLMHEAGVQTFTYALPLAMGIFIFCCYWLITFYKAKGYNTVGFWFIVILFIVGSAIVNLLHSNGTIGGYTLALLPPAIILAAGVIAKDLIGKQSKETGLIETIKTLTAKLSKLRREVINNEAELESIKTAKNVELERQRAILTQLIEQVEQKKLIIEQLKIEHLKAEKLSAEPTLEWAQALQGDALIFAGKSKRESAKILSISVGTLNNRLSLVNGQSLRGE